MAARQPLLGLLCSGWARTHARNMSAARCLSMLHSAPFPRTSSWLGQLLVEWKGEYQVSQLGWVSECMYIVHSRERNKKKKDVKKKQNDNPLRQADHKELCYRGSSVNSVFFDPCSDQLTSAGQPNESGLSGSPLLVDAIFVSTSKQASTRRTTAPHKRPALQLVSLRATEMATLFD